MRPIGGYSTASHSALWSCASCNRSLRISLGLLAMSSVRNRGWSLPITCYLRFLRLALREAASILRLFLCLRAFSCAVLRGSCGAG
jgi:hypothetical protein